MIEQHNSMTKKKKITKKSNIRTYKKKTSNKNPLIGKGGLKSKPKKKVKNIKKKPKVLEVPTIKISSEIIEVVKIPRKRRSKNGTNRMYFTQDTEDAIVAYNKEENMELREQIFRDEIQQPFQKLVENVFNTFKFSYFETGPQDVQKECLTHLVANMHKYKCEKGKAFSYFSIIAKHYLILLNNTNYKKFNQNIEISEERDEHTIQLQHVDKHHVQRELTEFIRLIVEFWENNVDKIFTKQRDLNIANAVVELFRNSDRIDAYNKKALYL